MLGGVVKELEEIVQRLGGEWMIACGKILQKHLQAVFLHFEKPPPDTQWQDWVEAAKGLVGWDGTSFLNLV